MIFAMVFTISCSAGDDGKDGKDGSSCTVEKNSDGKFEISCGGDPVGTFEDGKQGNAGTKGEEGDPGDEGNKGASGPYCWLGNKVSGTYQIICGTEGEGVVKGSLDICDVQNLGENEVTIKCGSTTVNLCLELATSSSSGSSQIFDPSKESCNLDGTINSTPTALSTCGTAKTKYDDRTQYCGYASATAKDATVLNFCNSDKSLKPNEGTWQDEYCGYTGPKTAAVTTVLCGKSKLNDGKWNGEYCGYASATAASKTVQKGACPTVIEGDEFKGPNEDYFGAGYCVADKKGRIAYTTDICGAGGKPNDGKWKGEYCGFANSSSSTTEAGKVYTGVCDDGSGPHQASYNNGYCKADKETGLTVLETNFCNPEKKTGKPNENKWKGEYCGFANSSASSADRLYEGVCDEGGGPNEASFNNGYCKAGSDGKTVLETGFCGESGKINEGEWKGEYCGYESATSTENDKVYTGACDDGSGPNTDGLASGYCAANRDGETLRSISFCGASGKPNEGAWKGEYCGYESAASVENDKVYTGICDDDGGPNKDGFASGYCQAENELASETIFSSTFCGESGKPNEGAWKGEYCFVDEKVAACTGGRIPDTSKKSTDPVAVRCTIEGSTDTCSESRPDLCDEAGCTSLGEEYEWDGECKEK
jgi:hypothetical protein